MGAVMPPELESTAHTHRNGNSAKLGVNGPVGDSSVMSSNGKISVKEGSGKLNGIVDSENHPYQEGETDEKAASMHVEGTGVAILEGAQMTKGSNEGGSAVETKWPTPTKDGAGILELSGKVTNGPSDLSTSGPSSHIPEGSLGVTNSSSDWTAAEGNSGWEVAEDGGLLGPGPTAEGSSEFKPTPAKEVHTYYLVRIPRPIDNKGKAEIRMADLRLKEKTEKRDFINAAAQMRRASRNEALDKLRAAREKGRACGDAVRRLREEIEPLQTAMKRFRDAGRMARDRSRDLPASEEELDQRIAYLEYRIQHESNPLKEEKLLLRDIKNLKACREEVCANAALHADFAETLGERDEIQERLKPLICELEASKAEWTAASEKIKVAEAEFEKAEEASSLVQAQLAAAARARQDVFEERGALIRQENAKDNEFYQNRRDIQLARQLAFRKDKKGVEEICNAQVERVLDLWNNNPEFRAAYIKSNERSTLKRLRTFDGRSLGPDEEPPLIPGDGDDAVPESRMEAAVPPTSRKGEAQPKGQTKPAEPNHVPVNPAADVHRKEHERESVPSDVNGNFFSAKISSDVGLASDSSNEEQVKADLAAAAESKEKRRQLEMSKAKEAEERKRKLAERAQLKASARAQKEAEKREKEREKRARKKAALGTSPSSQGDATYVETGAVLPQEVEAVPELPVLEPHTESKPSAKQRKRLIAGQKPKFVQTPVISSNAKKDGLHQQPWLWVVLGLILLSGILALIARYVL